MHLGDGGNMTLTQVSEFHRFGQHQMSAGPCRLGVGGRPASELSFAVPLTADVQWECTGLRPWSRLQRNKYRCLANLSPFFFSTFGFKQATLKHKYDLVSGSDTGWDACVPYQSGLCLSPDSTSDSSFLLVSTLGDNLGSCHPYGRSKLSSWLLALAWASPSHCGHLKGKQTDGVFCLQKQGTVSHSSLHPQSWEM